MLITLKDLVTLTQTVIGQDLNASLEKRGGSRGHLPIVYRVHLEFKNSIIMHTLRDPSIGTRNHSGC